MSDAAPRRVVYLSGTRADFGLMRSTLQRIATTAGLGLEVLVTGTHLSAMHGNTVEEIRSAGLTICAEIPLDMQTRTGTSMALCLAECLRGVSMELTRQRPDLLLLLGDRGEMLAGAIAALHLGIACVHVHGGERSGTVDESVRHAISKLSTHHFVATPGSARRLVSMGEDPARIHVTGAPGLDGLEECARFSRQACLTALQLAPGTRFALSLFHPVVQQAAEACGQMQAIQEAVQHVGLPVLWLEPNADAGSPAVLRALDLGISPAGSRRVTHLPRPLFLAALRHCEVLVGNSSAGIIEAASFGTPVVNIGDRQRLRERNANTIDVPAEAMAVEAAVRHALRTGHGPCDNIYGDGRAGERIADLLASLPLDRALLEKVNTY